MSRETEVLRAEFDLDFTYTRSTGPVVGHFLTELRDRRVVGIRSQSQGVICPPLEYDPKTAEALTEFVPVGDAGVVKTWSWVNEPREKHPLQKPFAWALIQLDGADTPMLHAVDAGSEAAMKTGLRVKIRWAEETRGHINDIVCFVPA